MNYDSSAQPFTLRTSTSCSRKIKNNLLRQYYETKIHCLTKSKVSPVLIKLACQDAPVERGKLETESDIRNYAKQCLKYYKKQLNDLERQEKWFIFKLFS